MNRLPQYTKLALLTDGGICGVACLTCLALRRRWPKPVSTKKQLGGEIINYHHIHIDGPVFSRPGHLALVTILGPRSYFQPDAAHADRVKRCILLQTASLITASPPRLTCARAMLTIGAPLYEWVGCLLLCSLLTCTLAQSTNRTTSSDTARVSSSTASTTTSFTDSYSTCPSRTINYITHTLPQQCLRTGWAATSQPIATEAPGTEQAATSLDVVIPWARKHVSEDAPASEQASQTPAGQGAPDEHSPSPPVAPTASDTTSTQIEAELETDSPLDNANFLSFEDWKKKNLAQVGQSPDTVGQGRANVDDHRGRRRPVNVNALDSLGEEGEIEINFSGFGSPGEGDAASSNATPNQETTGEPAPTASEADKAAPSSWALSKDAGKTYKERFNYASFDCAATVLKTNPKAKSTSSILVENKDSYMLTECSAENKYLVVELCDDILVDTVVLANYEFFSSMFRHFRISVSDRYPVKTDRWRVLGTFEARNSRDIQPFLIKEPQIWARYLRIEFLTHYGNEYYCPMSLLRVHGTTMMEQFRREEEQARGEDDVDEPIEAVAEVTVHEGLPSMDIDADKTESQMLAEDKKNASHATEQDSQATNITNSTSQSQSDVSTEDSNISTHHAHGSTTEVSSVQPTDVTKHDDSVEHRQPHSAIKSISSETWVESNASDNLQKSTKETTVSNDTKGAPSSPHDPSPATVNSPLSDSTHIPVAKAKSEASGIVSSGSSNRTSSESIKTNAQTHSSHKPAQTQPNPATPSTQESIFKSIHKRLQYLEANSTLSLQYIEEQSRILRDAFIKVEKKQLQKTEKFLDHLNSTVMHELKTYRNMYDQLWQSTILELEGMKERQRTEVGEIGARLSMMADELVWQKRMAVVQSTLLLLCLGLVLFVRSGTLNSQSDIPIAQQLGRTYSSFFETPPHDSERPKGSRHRKRFRDMWRSDTSIALSDRSGQLSDTINAASDVDTDDRRRLVTREYSPPTPVTPGLPCDIDKEVEFSPQHVDDTQENGLLTPTEDTDERSKRLRALETQSGPATPRGSRDNRPSWEEVDRAVDLLKAEEKDPGLRAQVEIIERRKQRRSPLRRAESYDGTTSDSLEGEEEGTAGYFVTR
ncbi:unnamed protein product [Periconia digitata]|uniref:SUN domain-containing protein n=1 Tax=Periconia digitata TaxID=1303443 RepID=A0A9W4XIJ3_9PLEO|nr:unnamed protein product [Periconia digitata]